MSQSRLLLTVLCLLLSLPSLAEERAYYIAADEVLWDYAPVKRNLMMDMPLNSEQQVFVYQSPSTIGSQYKKAIYREYTDADFTTLKKRPAKEQHLGMLGPLIRAEVGDTIKVVFKNQASRPYSMHPHGVFYTKANEGALTNDKTSKADKRDDIVQPGKTFVYHWSVPETAGPGPADGSSIVWLYHSHYNSVKDSSSGLIGAMIITAKGMANEDGSPKDIDREFVSLFSVMNENQSWYLDENVQRTIGQQPEDPEEFEEGNLMHMINGYVFANLPGLDMKVGDKVRWHLIAMGSEVDLHTPHWHGHTGLIEGHRTDVVELMPASMKSLDMIINNPGTWMYHCHVNDHIEAGMTALYHVQ